MIQVTKEQAEAIRKKFPDVPVPMTCRLRNDGRRRGKNYVQETNEILTFLKTLENQKVIETYGKV